jgi:acyl dehydratase
LPTLYFEDFAPDQILQHGPRLITREEIVAFAAQFDPQPMHLDEDAGRNSMLGGLGASGWHSCGIMMRMICDCFMLQAASMGAGGVEEVNWLKPVRPGDHLTLRATVLDKRASRTRPGMGIIRFMFELFNAHGERVMTMITPSMIELRNPGAAP